MITELTISEVNIICMFKGKTKDDTIDNIMGAMPYITDSDMKKLAEQTIIALDKMTDWEYETGSFAADYDEYD